MSALNLASGLYFLAKCKAPITKSTKAKSIRFGKVIVMTKEQKGKSIEFESFESDAKESISVDKAKKQESKAQELHK